MPINQSFSWWCFAGRGVEPDDLLSGAKKIGYSAVELVGKDMFQQVRDHGLAIASHPGHGNISSGLNDPREHDRIEREIKDNLEQAVKFGIPNLITFSGERAAGFDDEEGLKNCAAGLRRVVKEAEQAGVYLPMELLNSKVDHHGYQCDHTPWGVKLCEMVESPRVTLLYDIYHMQIMEGDLIATITANIDVIGHFHTGGVPGRHQLDHNQEVQWDGVMRAIADSGYKGYVAHEFLPTIDPMTALRQAVELCNV